MQRSTTCYSKLSERMGGGSERRNFRHAKESGEGSQENQKKKKRKKRKDKNRRKEIKANAEN
mgnify:CR=1 FL=1